MDNTLPAGIFYKLPREGAPDYDKGSMSIKVAEAVAWLQSNANSGGYVNLDLKVSKGGKGYCSKNTWEPKKKEVTEKQDLKDVTF